MILFTICSDCSLLHNLAISNAINICDTAVSNPLPNSVICQVVFPPDKRDTVFTFLKNKVELIEFKYDGAGKICVKCSPRMKDKIVGKYKKLIER